MGVNSLFFDIHAGSFVPPVTLTPADSALLVVDMQYHDAHPNGCFNVAVDAIHPGSMDYFNARTESTTVPAIARLLQTFRDRGAKVIHLRLGSQFEDYRDLDPRLPSVREFAPGLDGAEGRYGGLRESWSGGDDVRRREGGGVVGDLPVGGADLRCRAGQGS